MKQQYDKQQIAHLLDKFMAGKSSLNEEQVLAQYFRTHKVDDEWQEYKEMFALFDSGAVDIEQEVDVPVRAKKPARRVWLYVASAVAVAASVLLLLTLHYYNNVQPKEQLVAQTNVQPLPSHAEEEIGAVTSTPQEKIQTPPQTPPLEGRGAAAHSDSQQEEKGVTVHSDSQQEERGMAEHSDSSSSSDRLNYYIAQLEAEMTALDDSVREAHLEQLIAADVRLQQLVSRIVKNEVEQALNEQQKDSTANYITF